MNGALGGYETRVFIITQAEKDKFEVHGSNTKIPAIIM